MSNTSIADWHRPRNEECPQNGDSDLDCNCKRIRNRKPYRVLKVHDEEVPHGCKKDIILEVHPQGILIFRESGRRRSNAYATTVGEVYSRLVMNEAIAKMRAKKKARRK